MRLESYWSPTPTVFLVAKLEVRLAPRAAIHSPHARLARPPPL